jgi:hypothetical protein
VLNASNGGSDWYCMEVFMKSRIVGALALLLGTVGVLLTPGTVPAQSLSGAALIKALQQGGYVIVMRHTSSPREAPSKELKFVV